MNGLLGAEAEMGIGDCRKGDVSAIYWSEVSGVFPSLACGIEGAELYSS